MQKSVQHIQIQRQKSTHFSSQEDVVAVEEPLEIQVQEFGAKGAQSISVTMRTPGNDEALALGFLFTEGLLNNYNQIKTVFPFGENKVVVQLQKGLTIELNKTERNFYTTSSCGICGKSSIEAIKTNSQFKISTPVKPSKELLFGLQETLSNQQSLFSLTGGIHAAALFDFSGKLLLIQEDVGRHNALDKLIGEALKNEKLPLTNTLLLLSGRASFELIQKAVMAGIGIIAAVGAPSSLAVELAKEHNQTLIGFLKKDGFNVYSGEIS
ncbi:MAG: formate dehydrogenase accessory sulfurtransferase FdhD [Flavobacteriaceae bacterium]|nr:formate dehydrogenase accessory sulfurtransferase FdhD [Flavobacteriaceae bacterium]